MTAEVIEPPQATSPWEPLRIATFRRFWLASLASNFGTWIHEIGAGWLMTTLDATPEMVSAVRASMALPIVLLAIPAGVLADRIDKRKLLIGTQSGMLIITSLLAFLTLTGMITAWGLLMLTFMIGLGMVVHAPTWQSAVPELVPRNQISRAVGLGSINFNLARAAGPAVGGVLIAVVGIWSTFAINAMSFAGVTMVLWTWQRTTTESSGGRSFWRSMIQGVRFVARNDIMRHVMIGVGLFVLPGSALWSLMPLYARTHLGWGASGFGMMVAMIGTGALIGASQLPRLRAQLGADRQVAASMYCCSIGLFTLSFAPPWPIVMIAMLFMGMGWMATLTTLNATAQVTLPQRLRARGMGCYLTVMAGSMSLGSVVWGQVAGTLGLPQTWWIAAFALAATAVISLSFGIARGLANEG
ncbi:MAG: MFS transporter [Planctomycetota bacterium]